MRELARNFILYSAKYLGLCKYARRRFSGKTRILCYHAFAYDDEHRFRPSLFMRADLFRERLALISKLGFRVIPLSSLQDELNEPDGGTEALVITIDDGMRSVYDLAAPVLKDAGFPATVYVTTYYVQKGSPVFRLLMQYLAWRNGEETIIRTLQELLNYVEDDGLMALIEHAETQLSESERVTLSANLCELCDIRYSDLQESGVMCLMSDQQIRDLQSAGIDIELHTHRHVLPLDHDGIETEISDNRAYLERLVERRLEHFCYPSGFHSEQHLAPLQALGIRTATTCEPGFIDKHSNPLALPRFLDSDRLSMIEFEAELVGFKALIRSFRGKH